MQLYSLFMQLADALDGAESIEHHARQALQDAAGQAQYSGHSVELAKPFIEAMNDADAHPVCKLIQSLHLPWAPPETSSDKLYIEHSGCKAHVYEYYSHP